MNPMKDMIILLPGIMGSVLQYQGRDTWNLSGSALWNLVRSFGGNIQHLMLHDDDHSVDDLGDGVISTALLADTTIIPGFYKIDGYTKISKMIQSKFYVTKGDINSTQPANFYEFHYDWRRDNRVAARHLQKLIERQLPIWRDHVGDQTAKVVLIGHSMGGLIARHYLEVEGGWQNCLMLITFGTPYRGSHKIAEYMANGYKMAVDFTGIVRSLTSSYQLLPVYKSVLVEGNYTAIPEIDNFPNVDKAKAIEARKFHIAINDAVAENRKNQNYRDNFSIVPMVGNRQTTLQSGKLTSNGGTLTYTSGEEVPIAGLPVSGDGTVPMTSSIPLELKIENTRPFIEQHASLQNNSQVLEEVEFLLQNLHANAALSEAFGPENESGINLEYDDLYFTDEPLEMSAVLVKPVSFPTRLNASFENVDTGAIILGSFMPAPGTGRWELNHPPFPAGIYRAKVESNKPSSKIQPIHGLFAVSDRA